MKTFVLLIRNHLAGHRVRTMLTTLAIACSVCLLIWIVSIYSSAIRSYDLYASRALGRYALVVDPISRKADRHVPYEAWRLLADKEEVESADAMWAQLVTFRSDNLDLNDPSLTEYSKDGGWEDVMVGTDALLPPFEILRGRWLSLDHSDQWEAVVSQDFAEKLRVDVGDELEIPGPIRDRPTIEIVGVMGSPPASITGEIVGTRMFPGPSVGAVFVSIRDASAIHRTEPKISFVAISLREDVDVHEFRYGVLPDLYSLENPVQFMTDLDLEAELSEAAKASSLTLQAYIVGMIAVLLAFLVIFSTLSMGVSERTRQFALLRAIVLSKTELAMLIAAEGIVLAVMGLLVGIPIGSLLVILFDSLMDGMIRNGVHVDAAGIGLAILISVIASLVAAALPAWRATRVKPMDAVASQATTSNATQWSLSRWWALAAVPLLGVLPMVSFWYPPGMADSVLGRLVIGATCLAIGLVLLTPTLVRYVDWFCAPLVAKLLRLPVELLRQQLTSQLWRTVACVLTMSVGMGLFAGIQVWGWSMVQVFVPTDWAPEATLVFENPLSNEAIEQMAANDQDWRIAPLIVEQPRLRDDVLNSAEFPSVTRQMVAVMVGIDPTIAFGGNHPLIDADWYAGTPEQAVEQMKTNRGCVVPNHFLKQSNLKIGDEIYFVPPENPEQPVRYTIAGAIHLRGGQWMTKSTNMRQRTHRSAGLIFADFDSVLNDYQLPGPQHVWVDTEQGSLDSKSLLAVATSLPVQGDASDLVGEQGVELMLTTDIGGKILRSAAFWLWFMSVVPLIAIAISSIAMINTFLASIRARRWDFGVLRAVGYTRNEMVRLVMAEGILIGIVACIVGSAFGLVTGWSGTALTQATSWFGGMDVALAIPTGTLMIGGFVMVLFSLAAATIPAFRAGLTSPLTLLAQGRGMG